MAEAMTPLAAAVGKVALGIKRVRYWVEGSADGGGIPLGRPLSERGRAGPPEARRDGLVRDGAAGNE